MQSLYKQHESDKKCCYGERASPESWEGIIYAFSLFIKWRNGKRVHNFLPETNWYPSWEENDLLLQDDVLNSLQNLICPQIIDSSYQTIKIIAPPITPVDFTRMHAEAHMMG